MGGGLNLGGVSSILGGPPLNPFLSPQPMDCCCDPPHTWDTPKVFVWGVGPKLGEDTLKLGGQSPPKLGGGTPQL